MLKSASQPYVLKYQARCLAAVHGEQSRFLVGTTSLREANELHLIEFNEARNDLSCRGLFTHPGEIWHISCCPHQPALATTVFATDTGGTRRWQAALWRVQPSGQQALSPDSQPSPLGAPLLTLPSSGQIRGVVWEPSGAAAEQCVVVDDAGLHHFNFDGGFSTASRMGDVELTKLATAAWDPHRPHQVGVAHDHSLKFFDLRTCKLSVSIDQAHLPSVRDLDFNPNKHNVLASCGDDGQLKFWDLRNSREPLLNISAHRHWVWRVKYNGFHDQLVLTSSSDRRVGLWKAQSVSYTPALGDDDAAKQPEKDGLIQMFEEFEDSIYSIAWSVCDAWIFASVSYEGSVIVNHVPASEMYKIVL
eukprot:gnl/Spiro4/17537_TR9341_c0_g1_i1.p1 gnl/Spiro4/17537_TR9341_c0_g1~~gnl/Spiro4/17537_TR9341_c0_g1_i1.p1  ORF type:complete len:371 (-),score=55.33 gnl/Spiro4/17537_TR9341_c0_g1_i1:184-1266(-)